MQLLFSDDEFKQFQNNNKSDILEIISIALIGDELYKERAKIAYKIEADSTALHFLESPRTKNEVRDLCRNYID